MMYYIRVFQKALAVTCALALPVFLPSAAGAQKMSVLKSLGKKTGGAPAGTLLMDGTGNLFGTTTVYGPNCSGRNGCGVVFKVAAGNVYSVLYTFCSQPKCVDGYRPNAGVVEDSEGNLYGITPVGGSAGYGTIFKLSQSGSETVLHSFCTLSGCPDGELPQGSLVLGSDGNLYGATSYGGSNGSGVVFRLAPDGSNYSVQYNFCGGGGNCTDGANPGAGLIADSQGNLYGTTVHGGANNWGTVYKVAPDGTESVLYSFCSHSNCVDGATPEATLALVNGNLYGTTVYGGGGGSCSDGGCGVVFEVAPDGSSYSVLHAFAGSDGENPNASLVGDSQGNLFGVTAMGGVRGYGVLFELPSGGAETTLYNFCSKIGCRDGEFPDEDGGGLIMDASRNIYGTTWEGGRKIGGVVYKFTP